MAPPNCDALERPARAARNHIFPPLLSSGCNAKGAHHAHSQILQSARRTVHRDAEGHLFRREADPAGPAEDGQGSDVSRPQGGFRDSPGRDGKPGRTSEPDLRIDGTPRPRQDLRRDPRHHRRSQEVMDEFKGEDALDAGLTASAQTVEHYEIARYGALKTWARELGMEDAAKLLDETLQEEIETDKLLTQLATQNVNK